MTTPLTLTRPARIHCLARLRGVSGCFRTNQSNRGLTFVSTTVSVNRHPCPVARPVTMRPQPFVPTETGSLQIGFPVAQPGQRGAGGHFPATLIRLLVGVELAVFQLSRFGLGLFSSRWTIWHVYKVA